MTCWDIVLHKAFEVTCWDIVLRKACETTLVGTLFYARHVR